MTDLTPPFITDGISLGIPNTSATAIEQVDNAIFVDANGNLTFRDNFTATNTDVNGNPIVALKLSDLYTLIKGVFVSNGQLYFKDSSVSRPYSLNEIVGAYINWQNRLTTGGIFWIGTTRITNAECNNITVNIDGDPNLAVNTPSLSGDGRLFTQVNGTYPSNATGTQVFSIDEFLTTVSGDFRFNQDGTLRWFDIPNFQITIPPLDTNKVLFILAKTNLRLIKANSPITFRLYDTTTGVELDRKACENDTSLPAVQQPLLSFTGTPPTYQQSLTQLSCQCPTTAQTAGLVTEPPHILSVQFHVDDQLINGIDNVYSMMCENISGSLYEDVSNPNNILYDALERRLIGLPNDVSSTPLVNSSIDVIIFDTSPNDAQARKNGTLSFNNQSLLAVTFATPFTNASYSITLSCNMNINTWYTNKQPTGFTVVAGKAFTGSVDWIATKLITQGDG